MSDSDVVELCVAVKKHCGMCARFCKKGTTCTLPWPFIIVAICSTVIKKGPAVLCVGCLFVCLCVPSNLPWQKETVVLIVHLWYIYVPVDPLLRL